VAGAGQAATNATQAAGTNMANQNSSALMGAGNARASAYGEIGQTIGNTANGLASNYLLYKYLNPASPAPAPYGGGGTIPAGNGYTYSYPVNP